MRTVFINEQVFPAKLENTDVKKDELFYFDLSPSNELSLLSKSTLDASKPEFVISNQKTSIDSLNDEMSCSEGKGEVRKVNKDSGRKIKKKGTFKSIFAVQRIGYN